MTRVVVVLILIALLAPNVLAMTDTFDPEAATDAYLAKLTPEQRAASDAYFEGGYWLQLWSFVYGIGVAWLLLGTGLSARMRDLARRMGRKRPLESALYWMQYALLTALLTFPLTLYQGYFREHRYGLATQAFGGWLRDEIVGLLVAMILGAAAVAAIYGVIRHAPRSWWLWASVVGVAFLTFAVLIGPVYIDPLFNDYKELADPTVREPILKLARANGIPVTQVWEFDASRQSKRISANVAGLFGTERIALNDNLLNRCSLPEIEAVMAHEMGHYVLNHVYKGILEIGLVIVAGFAAIRWAAERLLRRWGGRWGIQGVGDVASLPLLAALLSAYFFLMTPVTNTIIRVGETEADIFGLNAARQPDGFAEVALKLGEYRKLAPGPLEEFVFFDHPSGRNRILMAMRWKKENL